MFRIFSITLLPISSNLSSAAHSSRLPSTSPPFQVQLLLSPNSSDPARSHAFLHNYSKILIDFNLSLCFFLAPPPLSFPTSLCPSVSLRVVSNLTLKMSLNNFLPFSTLLKIQSYSSMLLLLFSASRIVLYCYRKRPLGFSIPHTPPPLNLGMRKLRSRKRMRSH